MTEAGRGGENEGGNNVKQGTKVREERASDGENDRCVQRFKFLDSAR